MADLPVVAPRNRQELHTLVRGFLDASRADNTRRAYESDWLDFMGWCETQSLPPLPAEPQTIAAYLAVLAQRGRRVSTIRRRAVAIAFMHRGAGYQNPTLHPGVKAVLSGIARQIGSAPHKKAALTVDLLAKAMRKIPDDLTGLRDRAIILIGFAAALRRSELVDLKVNDVTHHPKGIVLTVRRSKTDQVGLGYTKAVPHGRKLGAVAAFDAWLKAAQITEGAIFRGVRGSRVLSSALRPRQVARIVKKRCQAIGLDPTVFAGHSLRSGFLTSASDSGARLERMKDHAGHAKLETTVGYVQIADAFKDHPGKGFL